MVPCGTHACGILAKKRKRGRERERERISKKSEKGEHRLEATEVER